MRSRFFTLTTRVFDPVEPDAAKVPTIGVLFWVIKVLTTGMGEAASDFMAKLFLPLAALVGLVGFWWALKRQLRAPSYSAGTYWLAVAMIAVFGTMAADAVHILFLAPYPVTTLLYGTATAVTLVAWYRSEGTLSIHSITTTRREIFYWTTVLATFALGTALGDLTATTFGLGYFASALVFGVLFALPGIAYRWWGLGATAAFWTAYVMTRPFGASIADGLAVSHARGGLALGTGPVSLVLFAAIVVCVALLSRRPRPSWERAQRPLGDALE